MTHRSSAARFSFRLIGLMIVAMGALSVFSADIFSEETKTASAGDRALTQKIAVLDLQKVLTESKAGKAAKLDFDKEFEPKKAVVAAREKAVAEAEAELRNPKTRMDEAARKAKEEKIAQEVVSLNRMKQDIDEELKKLDAELTARVLREVIDVTNEAGREGGYTLILQGTPQILYIDRAIDITDEVIRRYDAGRR